MVCGLASPECTAVICPLSTVFADDPNTPEVEPTIPFVLGTLVRNAGNGTAFDFRVVSGQPEIVENDRGLLIEFELIGR